MEISPIERLRFTPELGVNDIPPPLVQRLNLFSDAFTAVGYLNANLKPLAVAELPKGYKLHIFKVHTLTSGMRLLIDGMKTVTRAPLQSEDEGQVLSDTSEHFRNRYRKNLPRINNVGVTLVSLDHAAQVYRSMRSGYHDLGNHLFTIFGFCDYVHVRKPDEVSARERYRNYGVSSIRAVNSYIDDLNSKFLDKYDPTLFTPTTAFQIFAESYGRMFQSLGLGRMTLSEAIDRYVSRHILPDQSYEYLASYPVRRVKELADNMSSNTRDEILKHKIMSRDKLARMIEIGFLPAKNEKGFGVRVRERGLTIVSEVVDNAYREELSTKEGLLRGTGMAECARALRATGGEITPGNAFVKGVNHAQHTIWFPGQS